MKRTLTLAKIHNTDFYMIVCHDFEPEDLRGSKNPSDAAKFYVGTSSSPSTTLQNVVATFTDWGMEPTQLLEPLASKEVGPDFDFDRLGREDWVRFFGGEKVL